MMLYKKKKLQENKNRHDWAKPMHAPRLLLVCNNIHDKLRSRKVIRGKIILKIITVHS